MLEKKNQNSSLELNEFMVNSMISIINDKIESLKATNKDSDVLNIIDYVEKIIKYMKHIEKYERCVSANIFNGYFFASEIEIIKTIEDILKDIEELEFVKNDELKASNLKLIIYDNISNISAIIEKYLS